MKIADKTINVISTGKTRFWDTPKKKVGTFPHSSARVVNPNASPGLYGNFDATAHSVIGIVILKRIMPITENRTMFFPKHKRGSESSSVDTPTLFAPN